jgi:VCBS repeat-containing protein
VAGPEHGNLSGTGANLTYTPAENYHGPDSFTFKANDGELDSNVATVDITVTAVNDAPVAEGDSYDTNQDTALNVAVPGVLANDNDPDGDSFTAELVSGPSHGQLTLNANGSFTYTPNANYNGTDSFTYKANDATAASNNATVSITVNPVAEEPRPQISIADTTVNEVDTGTSNATFNVTLSKASTNAVTVDYTTADGTATQPEDYQQRQGTLTFAANQTTATVTVPVSGDTADEGDESFKVLLSNPQNAEIADGEASATIVDDDEVAPTTNATRSVEPNAAGWNNEDVTVTLTATDNEGGSGVKEITYSINGGQPTTVQGSSVQVPVSAEGETTIAFYATDNEGNIEQQRTTTVKIDKTAPAVSSISPINNATGVSPTAKISATFSESGAGIDPATLSTSTFTVVQVRPTGNEPVSGTVSYNESTKTVTFTPDTNLARGRYQVTITTGVEDKADNALANDYTWAFSTVGRPPPRM